MGTNPSSYVLSPRKVITTSLLFCMLCACEGVLDPATDAAVTPDTSTEVCNPLCPAGWVCQGGQCIAHDDPCVGISCSTGTRCENGACVEIDLCEGVVCPNPGDACQAGECVSGVADQDDDGHPASVDCDDNNPLVHPGSAETCNGRDDDCEPSTADGHDECPGSCCGSTPACQECCLPADCGDGGWTCRDFACICDGRMCNGSCVAGAGCCADSDCGDGEWECNDYQCFCPGDITP